jgi:predicted permease
MPVRISSAPTDLGHYYQLVARLKPGVTVAQEQAELQTLFSQFKAVHGDLLDDGEIGFKTLRYRESLLGNVGTTLWVLLGAVLLLLLIACVNVAHLQASRSVLRTREMAVRAALGAVRFRLIRQLITESAILALAGGVVGGLLISLFGVPTLLHLAPSGLPRVKDISLNFEMVAFAFLMSAVSLLISGLVPAFKATAMDLNTSLKTGAQRGMTGTFRDLTRGLFIGTEVALSAILLTGAILLMRSFVELERIDPGFDPGRVLAFKMSVSPKYSTTSRMWQFETTVLKRLDVLPGIESAASATSLPMEAGPDMPGEVLGQSSAAAINPAYRPVSPAYFNVLRIPVIRGRPFTDMDNEGSIPVAIVNATLARQAFHGGDAIGQRLRLGVGLGSEYADSPRLVVGIVGDVRETSLAAEANPTIFVPRAQIPDPLTPLINKVLPLSVAVRTRIPPAQLIESIRRAIVSVDPQQPIADVRTMDRAISGTLDRQRFTLLLMTLFALLAMIMACVGIYGVVSDQVRQRERELGIRLAIGAAPQSLVHLIVMGGMRPIAAGILVGLCASYGFAKLIRSLLFGTTPHDPISFGACIGALSIVAFLGVYLPAKRASSLNPIQILREE